MGMEIKPVTLIGSVVRLEPLEITHREQLALAARSEAINWELMLLAEPPVTAEAMGVWIQRAVNDREAGKAIPFVIIEVATGEIVGSTRYFDFSPVDYSLEIGFTWLSGRVQRTGVNTECKYLLLRHAFETWKALRVQFKTDARNLRSQRAIERLGAVKEGTFRNHRLLPNGYRRSSVYYSIIESEWADIKARLEAKMCS